MGARSARLDSTPVDLVALLPEHARQKGPAECCGRLAAIEPELPFRRECVAFFYTSHHHTCRVGEGRLPQPCRLRRDDWGITIPGESMNRGRWGCSSQDMLPAFLKVSSDKRISKSPGKCAGLFVHSPVGVFIGLAIRYRRYGRRLTLSLGRPVRSPADRG